jgi:RNA polymerase sigma factor (TIGR02999 family)
MASTVMRRVLVNYALKRKAAKRGGGLRDDTLDEERLLPEEDADAIIDLHEALSSFEELYPRQGEVVQLRFFGGLTTEEIADSLSLSTRTVERDVKFAKAWLSREMKKSTNL